MPVVGSEPFANPILRLFGTSIAATAAAGSAPGGVAADASIASGVQIVQRNTALASDSLPAQVRLCCYGLAQGTADPPANQTLSLHLREVTEFKAPSSGTGFAVTATGAAVANSTTDTSPVLARWVPFHIQSGLVTLDSTKVYVIVYTIAQAQVANSTLTLVVELRGA